jgi:excinuclease ABC subunit C
VFAHSVALPAEQNPAEWQAFWAALPDGAAVFALRGAQEAASVQPEDYIAKTANLRWRMRRLLAPDVGISRRLHLAGRVQRLEYTQTGSDFETALLLYGATCAAFGERAHKRLHLRAPALLRMACENPYPRVYGTSRIARRSLEHTYGPFPSRAAAERFLEEMLNLFLLRRCVEDLAPDPAFPGCVYSEMKMCLAPCFQGCTDARYAEESSAVQEFLQTRGAEWIARLEQERAQASAALEFEHAAQAHARLQKAQAAAQLCPPLVHPLAHLDAVIVQQAARAPQPTPEPGVQPGTQSENCVALFWVHAGRTHGPAIAAVEEASLAAALQALAAQAQAGAELPEELAGHLALLARWYYRPATKRAGEIFFRNADGQFSVAKILRGALRVLARGTESPAG